MSRIVEKCKSKVNANVDVITMFLMIILILNEPNDYMLERRRDNLYVIYSQSFSKDGVVK